MSSFRARPRASTTVRLGRVSDSGLPGFVYSARPLDSARGVPLYAGTSAPNVSLANYSALADPGDLDGDGHGDVVARDAGGHCGPSRVTPTARSAPAHAG